MEKISSDKEKYLSYLMGAPKITDEDIVRVGAEIVGRVDSGSRRLTIPKEHIADYERLIIEKLDPGFWNEYVGEREIVFLFKTKDGSVKRYVYAEENRLEIAKLCSTFNGDPLEKTSQLLEYIAGNEFYTDLIQAHYLGK